MKLKGIWVAIAVICVAGIGITDYSARHLAAGETQYVSEETVEKNVSGQAAVVSAVTEAGMAEVTKADEGAGSEQAAGAAGSDGKPPEMLGQPECFRKQQAEKKRREHMRFRSRE